MKKLKIDLNGWSLVYLSLFITFAIISSVFIISLFDFEVEDPGKGGVPQYADGIEEIALLPVTQGLTYTLINEDTEYCVSRGSLKIEDVLVIPEEYEGKKVTAIAQGAFKECYYLTTIVIPKTITVIGEDAFLLNVKAVIYTELLFQPTSGWEGVYCPIVFNYKFNDIADNNYIYVPINGLRYCLRDGKAEVVATTPSVTTISIPASVTYKGIPYIVNRLGDGAFYEFENLKSVSIASSVTSISMGAFSFCKKLDTINIPSTVTSIANSAFYSCTSLRTISIPLSVVSMQDDVFEHCSALTIYVAAQEKPQGWSDGWNSSACPVVWGQTAG